MFDLQSLSTFERSWQTTAWHGTFDLSRLAEGFSVDAALASGGLRYPYVKVSRSGTAIPPQRYTQNRWAGTTAVPGFADVKAIRALYEGGASVILNRMEEWSVPVARIAHRLAASYSGYVEVSAFATPRGGAALPRHRDCQDLVVLQLAGTKRWTVEQASPVGAWEEGPAEDADAHTEVSLTAGDAMYLPRGAAHGAVAGNEPSVHITFGLNRIDKGDLTRSLQATVADVIARQPLPLTDAQDRDFREQLFTELRQVFAASNAIGPARETPGSRSNADPDVRVVGA